MTNFIANGHSLQVIAPVGGVVGGDLFKQGALVGCVVASAAEGQQFTLVLMGAFGSLKKVAGEAWVIGDKIYLKNDGSGLSKDSTNATFAGFAYSIAESTAVVGDILLCRA